jgi:pentatricopeptide repeat protein
MTSSPRYVPRHPPYNTMIQFFQTKGDRASALDYFDRMLKAKVPLTDHTYRLLIDVYGTIAPVDPASALDVFRLLERDAHVAVQGMHWAALVTMYGVQLRDADKAIQVFDAIDSHISKPAPPIVQPDPLVYEALFNALWACDRSADVERYRERMRAHGSPMTAYTANALIKVRRRVLTLQDPSVDLARAGLRR